MEFSLQEELSLQSSTNSNYEFENELDLSAMDSQEINETLNGELINIL